MTAGIQTTSKGNPLRNVATILILVLGLLFIAANILIYGRDDSLTIHLNTVLNPLVAFIVTVMAFLLLVQVRSITRARIMWIGLVLGWACWTAAEVIWTIAFLQGMEPPYPSWADLFWVVAYIPMFIALGMRVRQSSNKPSAGNILLLALICLGIIGFTVWGILLPIIQQYDPSAAVESALNLIYPLADTVLIVMSLIILFGTRRGSFSAAWTWIALGFIIDGVSDLFFTYLSGQNLYYPEGIVNWMSVFAVDVPYTLSYMIYLVGLVLLLQVQKAPTLPTRPQPVS